MGYLPNSEEERRSMLAAIGLDSPDQLFAAVPESLRGRAFTLPPPLDEQALTAEVGRLAARNRPVTAWDSFLGAGLHHRHIPAIVRATISRPEFYTTYTPYQAEASQGTLQTIFEFQSMICALTGLDVANASLYDGSTAAAEAVLLAAAHTGRDRIAVSAGLHPETARVLETYCRGRGLALDVLPTSAGRTPAGESGLDERHAALLVAQPSFLGTIEDLAPLAEAAHAVGALAICSIDPFAATVLIPPGEAGYDVAVGDVQPLGIPLSFGGPHAGFMAVREHLLRRLPGRLVGMTSDAAGRRAFTLTLQAREQHIRRERATSNVCTNHALMALAATVYMAVTGAIGMRAIATTSVRRAHELCGRLAGLDGFEPAFPDTPFLWEFTLRCPGPAAGVAAALRSTGIIAGLPLDGARADCLLVCCTEMTSPESMDRYVAAAGDLAAAATRPARPPSGTRT